jgi:E3 ubiquitin-protein ligase BAH
MKFAHEYQEQLVKEGFPPHWVSSSISYGQLKKCIKRVTRELASIGLDASTLHQLLQSVETSRLQGQTSGSSSLGSTEDRSHDGIASTQEKPFHYLFSESSVERGLVKPQLLFVVDSETGAPLDAGLAPETRNYLHQLAVAESLTDIRIADETGLLSQSTTVSSAGEADNGAQEVRNVDFCARSLIYAGRPARLVSVPLTSDSEFFTVLEKELLGLVALQNEERRKLSLEIQAVGTKLGNATNPDASKGRADLEHWRKIFELYLDSNIFFTSFEQDHGVHGGKRAQMQYDLFLKRAMAAGLMSKFKQAESAIAFDMFLSINNELLQCLKFQEINHLAMKKILKSSSSPPSTHQDPMAYATLTKCRIRQTNCPRRQGGIPFYPACQRHQSRLLQSTGL